MIQLFVLDVEIGSWATKMLRTYTDVLLGSNPEAEELRAAGVSERRIEALYPMDLAAFQPAIERLSQSRAACDAAVPEIRANAPQQDLWVSIPYQLRPRFPLPDVKTDGELLKLRLTTLIAALSTLRQWPFAAYAQALGFNGNTLAEQNMRALEQKLPKVTESLERLLDRLATAA